MVNYEGTQDALIAIGVATADILARGAPGKTRRDSDGDRCLVDYRKGWVRLRQHKMLEQLNRMAGVSALLIRQADEEWQEQRQLLAKWASSRREPVHVAGSRSGPSLRLVWSNPAMSE
jgi:hypothetical protein